MEPLTLEFLPEPHLTYLKEARCALAEAKERLAWVEGIIRNTCRLSEDLMIEGDGRIVERGYSRKATDEEGWARTRAFLAAQLAAAGVPQEDPCQPTTFDAPAGTSPNTEP